MARIWLRALAIGSVVLLVITLPTGLAPHVLFAMGLQGLAAAATAYSELGPAGTICLSHEALYEYEPNSARIHWGVLRDLPETAVRTYFREGVSVTGARASEVFVEHISIDINKPHGPTEAHTRIRWSDGAEEHYSVRLHSGNSRWVSLDTPSVEIMLCSKGFGNWVVYEARPISSHSSTP